MKTFPAVALALVVAYVAGGFLHKSLPSGLAVVLDVFVFCGVFYVTNKILSNLRG